MSVQRVLKDQGFVWDEGRRFWVNVEFPFITGHIHANSNIVLLRGGAYSSVRTEDPVDLVGVIRKYKANTALRADHIFAREEIAKIVKEMTQTFPEMEFTWTDHVTGVPMLHVKHRKHDEVLNLVGFDSIMESNLSKKLDRKCFTLSYAETITELLSEKIPVSEDRPPVVKVKDGRTHLFTNPKMLRHPDTWRLKNVVEINPVIITTTKSGPALLMDDMGPPREQHLIEFICEV